ncbi:MAG: signal recognition particle receptor subunit alpha, partial [Eubacterium sp.]|nr:signal recognition particle receptor subunit alpha [Eubacterium sp.]
MAFDSLSDKMQNVFKKLRSKGLLDEADVKEAMKEVKRALLEADVNFKVVKNFVNTVTDKAIGEDVMKGLNPGQMVIKIVKDELVSLMGEEVVEMKLLPSNEQTIIMMCGLQGAGKTTTVAKLAGQYKNKGKKPLLVACDIYRPAAIEQLKTNGEKVGVPVFEMGTDHKPVEIVQEALKYARANGINLVFIDTAGRLHIDTDMMDELKDVKREVEVNYT